MKKFQKVTKTTDEVKEITCDRCGKRSVKNIVPVGMDPYIDTISVYWGYGSKYDGELWEFDLCEKCIEETLGVIKHSTYNNEIDPDCDPEYDGLV